MGRTSAQNLREKLKPRPACEGLKDKECDLWVEKGREDIRRAKESFGVVNSCELVAAREKRLKGLVCDEESRDEELHTDLVHNANVKD